MYHSDNVPVFPFLPEVITGETADVYFLRTRSILRREGLNPWVGMQVFPGRAGIFCGIGQVEQLLRDADFEGEMWAAREGTPMARGEAMVQIFGPYDGFGIYETAILGILASNSGWATAARAIIDVAEGTPVTSFGARHLHPNVAALMDYAAIVAGCDTCSTTLGASLAGTEPSGTMPHALILIVGDTVKAAEMLDRELPTEVARVVLVDTFQDEAIESIRVGNALGKRLQGVRLDTPRERGGVTPALVQEVRARLDDAQLQHVQIVVSGGVTPERIAQFREHGAPIDSYGVGSFISAAPAIDFTADIREIDGEAIAKRGRIPGMERSPQLGRIL